MKKNLLLSLAIISSLCTQAQNVGIGTTTPTTILEVAAHGKTGILSYTDSAMGPGFSYSNYNNAPAGIRGEYRGTGLNHGSGVVGTALSTQTGYGNGITGKGGYVGVMGLGSAGGFSGIYAAANTATWGLYVDGNARVKGKVGISQNANFTPVKELDVDGDVNIGYSLSIGSDINIVENATIGGSAIVSGTLKIQGGNPGAGKTLTSDAAGNASWQSLAIPKIAFDAYPSNNQNFNATATFTITGWAEDFDLGNHLSTNDTVIFTAPIAGLYHFDARITIYTSSTGGGMAADRYLMINKMSGSTVTNYRAFGFAEDSNFETIGLSQSIMLLAGDRVFLQHGSTFSLPNPGYTISSGERRSSFSGYLVFPSN